MMTITVFSIAVRIRRNSRPSSIHCVQSIQRKELTSRRWLCRGRCPEGGAQREVSRGWCPELGAQREVPRGWCPEGGAQREVVHFVLGVQSIFQLQGGSAKVCNVFSSHTVLLQWSRHLSTQTTF